MFGQLQDKFTKIFKIVKGHGKISENNIADAIRQIRIALLESDVNFKVVSKFINNVKEKSMGQKVFDSVTPGQQFIKLVLDELIVFLESENSTLNLNNNSLSVIVLAGLQGSGKTTTAAKIAGFLKKEFNKKVLLVGLDLRRPAASIQLKILAENNNLNHYVEENSKDVFKVLNNGFDYAKSLGLDTIILDTSGRLHIDDDLIQELNKIILLSKPSEILYVADSMTGQDAVNTSDSFAKQCKITGCILTKMDGDSGGGAALSIKEITKTPLKFITSGEKISDIEYFNPDRMARRILGLQDVVGLVEEASKSFDAESIKDLEKQINSDNFNLNTFRAQLDQMENMGSLSKMIKLLPNMKKLANKDMNNNHLVSSKAVIDSMTFFERENPDSISGSRRKRIALGSGTSLQKVNQLLKQFKQMKLMMKKMKNRNFNKLPFNI
jgi:signal recognition particle subunit SRP54